MLNPHQESTNKQMQVQKIIHHLFILIALATFQSCQQKTANKELKLSAKIEAVQPAATQNKSSNAVEKPAVIYRSKDTGRTWSSFAKGIPEDATLSGIKQLGNKIYVTTDYHGVFVATDGQNNWEALNKESLGGLDINCIAGEANHLIVGTLRKGIFISKDGGVSWESSQGNIKAPIRAFLKSANTIYAGTDSGIYESVDMGKTWSPVFGQLQILGFTALEDKLYAATQKGMLMAHRAKPSDWKFIYEGDALHDVGNDGEYIYAMTIGQQLLKTKNDGASWENAQRGIVQPANYYTNEIQHLGNDIFSAQWIGIYHSSDNGDSWSKLDGLPDSTAFSTLEVTDYGIIAGISIR